jgi:hypothetical protein
VSGGGVASAALPASSFSRHSSSRSSSGVIRRAARVSPMPTSASGNSYFSL